MKVIVVGVGDVGSFLAHELSQKSEDVVVIDDRGEVLERIEESCDVMSFKGNGTFRKNLLEVGVQNADLVLGVTGHDHTNLVVAAMASELGARRTLARVDAPEFFSTQSGIQRDVLGSFAIVCASRLVSSKLLQMIRCIDMPFVKSFSGNSLCVALVEVKENFRHLKKPGSELDLGRRGRVLGVFRDGQLRRCLDLSHIDQGDQVLISTSLTELPLAFRHLVQVKSKKAVIIGGGDVGSQLALSLEQVEDRLMIVDIDRRRCEFLTDHLNHARVFHGDGTNLEFLKSEHVEEADYTVSVTKKDEVNLMSSLLARELNVPHTYSLVHRPGYSDVYSHLGVQGTTSAHELILKTVERYFPNQPELSREPIAHTGYVIGELQLPRKLKSKNLRVQDLPSPPNGVLVGVLSREEVKSEGGNESLEPEDVCIFVCKDLEFKKMKMALKAI